MRHPFVPIPMRDMATLAKPRLSSKAGTSTIAAPRKVRATASTATGWSQSDRTYYGGAAWDNTHAIDQRARYTQYA